MQEGRSNEAAVTTEAKDEERKRGFKYIPEEMVLNILPNLPATTLLQFRCVSKQWSCLISQDITQVQPKVIVPTDQLFLFQSIDQNSKVEEIEIDVKANIYGSCNGFLLIRVGINLILWNPTSRRSYGVLTYRLLDRYPPENVIPGLCFDSRNNDYKVVLGLDDRNWRRQRSVWVGSFATKSWSSVDFAYGVNHFHSGPTLRNYLHWWSTRGIIYFDPKTDKFRNIYDPKMDKKFTNIFDDDEDDICGLGVLDGCLCMAKKDYGGGVKVYGMKQHGVKSSWKVMFDVNNVNFYEMTPLYFTDERKREVLIHVRRSEFEENDHYEWGLWHDKYAIVALDIDNHLCTDIVVSNVGRKHYDGPVVYEETLVRMKNKAKVGKQVWRVKESETKSTNVENEEDENGRRRKMGRA